MVEPTGSTPSPSTRQFNIDAGRGGFEVRFVEKIWGLFTRTVANVSSIDLNKGGTFETSAKRIAPEEWEATSLEKLKAVTTQVTPGNVLIDVNGIAMDRLGCFESEKEGYALKDEHTLFTVEGNKTGMTITVDSVFRATVFEKDRKGEDDFSNPVLLGKVRARRVIELDAKGNQKIVRSWAKFRPKRWRPWLRGLLRPKLIFEYQAEASPKDPV